MAGHRGTRLIALASVTGMSGAGRRRVAVIGAGPGGICMAIKLREAGIDDFVMFEKAPGIGGTWWHNTYPGAACDVPSHLYSFSFAPNLEWTEPYSGQAEILAYFERFACEFALESHLRLGVTVVRARWDEETARWHVDTDHGRYVAEV